MPFEGWFAPLERHALYPGVSTGIAELTAELRRSIKVHNEHSTNPFEWTKPAGKIIAAVGRAMDALHN